MSFRKKSRSNWKRGAARGRGGGEREYQLVMVGIRAPRTDSKRLIETSNDLLPPHAFIQHLFGSFYEGTMTPPLV